MTGLADVDGFRICIPSVRVVTLPHPGYMEWLMDFQKLGPEKDHMSHTVPATSCMGMTFFKKTNAMCYTCLGESAESRNLNLCVPHQRYKLNH